MYMYVCVCMYYVQCIVSMCMWMCVHTHMHMCVHVCTYMYSVHVSYLHVLIEEHHTMFIEIYQDKSFIPKLHYLVHYPDQIRSHGPLIRAWTMRYEGKLYFKQISHKNITLTLASRHQHWLVYHLHSEMMFTPELVCGPITSCTKLNEESIQLQLLIQQCVQPITSSHWIKVNGLKYSTVNHRRKT